MFSFSPDVDLPVIALAPGFRAISILVEAKWRAAPARWHATRWKTPIAP